MISQILIALICTLAIAAPTAETKQACDKIAQELGGKVLFPGEPAYRKESRDYYNIGLAELTPACIAMPSSAQDVSKIVRILKGVPSVNFAVKSGGHDPNPGHSSIKDGVLIALRNVAGTEYDPNRQVACRFSNFYILSLS